MMREEIISNLLYMKRSVKEDTIEDRTIDEAIKALEQEPCEDVVSRQAVLDALRTCFDTYCVYDENNGIDYIDYDEAVDEVLDLPPVTPKQRTGKWITVEDIIGLGGYYRCSSCGNKALYSKGAMAWINTPTRYCPHCGAKMEGESK